MAKTVEQIVADINELYDAENTSVPEKILTYCVKNTVAKVKAYCNTTSLSEGLELLIIDIVRKNILLDNVAVEGAVASVTEGSATTQYHKVFNGLASTEFADTIQLFKEQLNMYRRAGTV